MEETFEVRWAEAMDWWKGQTDIVQRLIRRIASDKLIETVAVPKVFQRKNKRARNRVIKMAAELNEKHADEAWGNRYHTTGGKAVIVCVEEVRKEHETKYKPCYC